MENLLHYFLVNLFRTLHNEFYQNQPSFTEDVTKHLAYFSLGNSVEILKEHDFGVLQGSVETLLR